MGLLDMLGAGLDDPRNIAALRMGGLISQGAVGQTRPQSLFGLLGQGAGAYSDTMRQARADEMERERFGLSKDKFELDKQEQQARIARMQDLASLGVSPDDPAAVREWQYFNSLPPEQQQKYLELKRQTFAVRDIGGVPSAVRMTSEPQTQPLSTLSAEASGRATIAGAEEQARQAQRAAYDLMPAMNPQTGRIEMVPRLNALGAGSRSGAPMLAPEERRPSMELEVGAAQQEVKRTGEAPQRISLLQSTIERRQSVLEDIKQARDNVEWMTSGVVGKATQTVPQTPAYNLRALINSIKARIGFNELAQMRLESPTGGALGQVAIQELDALQNSLGSLDLGQSPDALRSEMDKVEKRYNSVVDKLQRALEAEKSWLSGQGGTQSGSRLNVESMPSIEPRQAQGESTSAPLPPAHLHKGKTIRNTVTGERLRSDGLTWKPL